MKYDITLYTPGGLFLDTYEDVDHEGLWWPNDKIAYLRFSDPKTNLEVKTSLPFLAKRKPKTAAELAMEEYEGH